MRATAFPIAVERDGLAEQLFLRAEGAVQAGRVDAYRGRQVGQRRAFVAFLPEQILALRKAASGSKVRGRPRSAMTGFYPPHRGLDAGCRLGDDICTDHYIYW